MDIYDILSSINHNPRYLKKYIRFIEDCLLKNQYYDGIIEKHHICPRAMFPEYISLTENSWNRADLTPRQHFIAHLLLWKVYPAVNAVKAALFFISHKDGHKINSKLYEKLKIEYSVYQSEIMSKMVEDGTHPFLSEKIKSINKERMSSNNPMSILRHNNGTFKKGHKPVITKERNEKLSKSKMGDKNQNFGKKGCFDHINKNKVKCEHCDMFSTIGNIKRWHNDNCKNKTK